MKLIFIPMGKWLGKTYWSDANTYWMCLKMQDTGKMVIWCVRGNKIVEIVVIDKVNVDLYFCTFQVNVKTCF